MKLVFETPIRWLRISIALIWIAIASIVGSIYSLLRFGNLDNNAMLGQLYAVALPIIGIKRVVEGAEHLNRYQPCVYICNHQGILDVPLCGSLSFRQLVIIGKKELKYFPFFGMVFAAGGNFFIDRGNRVKAVASLSRILEKVKAKRACVFVFPEGTRNRVGGTLLPFKKGAFVMAVDAQIPIVPLVWERLDRVFDRHTGRMGGTLRVRFLPPIQTTGMSRDHVESLIESSYTQMLNVLKDFDRRPLNQ